MIYLGPNNPNGQATRANSTPVVIASDQTVVPVIDNDITAAGTITAAAQTVVIVLNGNSGAAIQITGTWVGTLQFEGTLDGTNWIAINAVAASTSLPERSDSLPFWRPPA